MKNNELILFLLALVLLIIPSCKKVEKQMLVETVTTTSITNTAAEVTGNIVDLGSGISQHGHCYAKTPNVTIEEPALITKLGTATKTGEYKSSLSNLSPDTKYYVKAYCSRGQEVIYGKEINFATGKNPPSATIADATMITNITATLNGSVNANGNSTTVIFEYGITTSYGSTAPESPLTVTGSSIININTAVTGLTSGSLYHYRIKAINAGGTTYSDDLTFFTLCSAPSATTNSATNIENTSVTFNGSVNANGCSTNVTFDYGLTTSYGLTLTAVQSPVNGATLKNVNVVVSGLTSGLTYHYRLKAINSGETVYGGDIIFATKVADPDGNVYNTITIGVQVWMKENLKTTKFNDGTSIPLITDGTTWSGLTTPGYCWWNNIGSNEYGALYNWYTVNTGKLCPLGWHVPTDAEWSALIKYIDSNANPQNSPESSIAGGKLKETGTNHWNSPNTGATNETNFTAFAGGYRSVINGNFGLVGTNGYYQSATQVAEPSLWNRGLMNYNTNITRGTSSKSDGLSVRCLRDY
jgi:uncharacterized protein (TIGR02145 family)